VSPLVREGWQAKLGGIVSPSRIFFQTSTYQGDIAMTETNATVCQNHSDNPATEAAPSLTFTPRVDIFETDTAYFVYADLPGALPHDIDLRYEQGELFLRGKVAPRTGNGRTVFAEYEVGDFSRVFQVHESIDSAGIDAAFKNGVLTVRLPKAEAAKPKQVPINVKA
jgi:HSP20 family protein